MHILCEHQYLKINLKIYTKLCDKKLQKYKKKIERMKQLI